MARLNLKSENKLNDLRNGFIKEAQRLELTEDYLFVQTFNAFEDQLKFMNDLKKQVDTSGLMVVIPIGKDNEKLGVNPAVSEYNKMASLANKYAQLLTSMISEAKKETPVNDGDLV